MLRATTVVYKKGWTHTPGKTRRGGKNLAWRPKISETILNEMVRLNLIHPRRHPNSWQERQFHYLGYTMWPKEVAFYNCGDNFELSPEASWRVYLQCRDEPFWTKLHNEHTIISLLPDTEQNPDKGMKRVTAIFRHHLRRFGADHYIYNAMMQAAAFARQFQLCERMIHEMHRIGLEPNGQTYVNMMLACKLSGMPIQTAESYFREGVKQGALQSVLRLDTEFQMWMDQLDRLGSFTTSGHLSIPEDHASPMPRDMFATWGWDKSEPKFRSQKQIIDEVVRTRVRSGKELIGTVYSKTRRQPWGTYRGLFPWDFNGPPSVPSASFDDAPLPSGNEAEEVS